MAGNKEGGRKAAETNKQKYGKDFYANIGKEGGKKGHTGGFYYMKHNGQLDKLKELSGRGGEISRRTKKNV